MGSYLNRGNAGFTKTAKSKIYVDKTMLISCINDMVNEEKNCVAVSHARRFGKSQAARMLEAYYTKDCDSRQLFENFNIAKEAGWDRYLNKFNVIHLDIATLVNSYKQNLISNLKHRIHKDLEEEYPGIKDMSYSLTEIMYDAYKISGSRFVVIIDEWDSVIRNYAHEKKFVHEYMQFLHDIFKSEESQSFLALGYITGILPIKKIDDESALNNFREYTMINSRNLNRFFGFTDEEVDALCIKHNMDREQVKQWYDGYLINGRHIYNPNSVALAMMDGSCDSYWKNTASFDAINRYICLNFEGLKDDVLRMLAGGRTAVDTESFQNDLSVIRDKSEALTALIHLGYLAYDAETSEAFIPNYEVATAFKAALVDSGWTEISKSIENAQRALNAMLDSRAEEFAEYVDQAHEAYTSVKNYNDENALYNVLYMTLFTARAYYNVERELPTGKGFADMVLLPRKNTGNKPAVVLELKYDQSAETAIRQIKEKRYTGKLDGYADKAILVGINYDKKTKKHSCVIEKMSK